MSELVRIGRSYVADAARLWDQFWFRAELPHTLAAIRIATGAMLLYTHLIWAKDFLAFLGPDAWVTGTVAQQLHSEDYAWSYLWFVESPTLLWTHHLVTLLVMACLMLGLFTRIVAPCAWFLQIMYVHRHCVPLDQANLDEGQGKLFEDDDGCDQGCFL